MGLEELERKHQLLKEKSDVTFRNADKIIAETKRVEEVAANSSILLDSLEKSFEEKTGIQGKDIAFLFFATGLQVARIAIINELTKIEVAGSQNRNETKLHDFQEKLLKKMNADNDIQDRPYYSSMNHIVTKMGVPYDASASLTQEYFDKILGKGKIWESYAKDMIRIDKFKLLEGANHRFATLGHDPVVGLVIGTGNIMTNTITCVSQKSILPIVTNHVVYTENYKDPHIATQASTIRMIYEMIKRTKEDPKVLVASLIKQIIHIGTDIFTPCGIQIPFANLVLSNANVEKITKFVSTGDLIKVGASAGIAELINMLIGAIHRLTFNEEKDGPEELFRIRTKKIIDYSNLLATGSNALWTSIKIGAGDAMAKKQLDIGGAIILIKHLLEDEKYISKIKEEYVFGGFLNQISGEPLDLEEKLWENMNDEFS